MVERKGKNSALTVTDPKGEKAGQMLLDAFVEKLAIDLPRFIQATDKEKADTLLKIIGVEEQLSALRKQEREQYSKRHTIGQIADQKAKYAKEQPYYPDAPKEPVSAMELIREQQDILAKNGENQRKREQRDRFERELAEAEAALEAAQARLTQAKTHADIARKDALDLQDESTAALEESIRNIEDINRKVRANLDREKADDDARDLAKQYEELSQGIENTRNQISALLQGADLPLPELSVNEDGGLTYKGFTWGDMSSSEQLKVATAIVRKLNPQCGFVLIDRLEAMDIDTLKDFGQWLEAEGLQAIATRVSTGSECQIIIEDGMAVETEPAKGWKEGTF